MIYQTLSAELATESSGPRAHCGCASGAPHGRWASPSRRSLRSPLSPCAAPSAVAFNAHRQPTPNPCPNHNARGPPLLPERARRAPNHRLSKALRKLRTWRASTRGERRGRAAS
eukprot:4933962-Prymnesium_polylepis.2